LPNANGLISLTDTRPPFMDLVRRTDGLITMHPIIANPAQPTISHTRAGVERVDPWTTQDGQHNVADADKEIHIIKRRHLPRRLPHHIPLPATRDHPAMRVRRPSLGTGHAS